MNRLQLKTNANLMYRLIKISKNWQAPLNISLIYIGIGVIWILFSDWAIDVISADAAMYHRLQMFKGFFYVIITGALLFVMIYEQIKKQNYYIELLRDQNKLLNFVMRSQVGINILVIEKNERIIFASGNEQIIENESINDLAGKTISQWLEHTQLLSEFQTIIKNIYQLGDYTIDIELNNQWYKIHGEILKLDEQQQQVVTIQITNVTDHKSLIELNKLLKNQIDHLNIQQSHTLEQLQSSIQKHQTIFNGLYNGVIIHELDANGRLDRIAEVNLAATLLFNVETSELINRGIERFVIFESDNQRSLIADNNFLKNNRISITTRIIPGGFGETKDIEILMHLIVMGGKNHVIGIYRDLTDHMTDLKVLKKAYADIDSMMGLINEGLMIISPKRNCLFWNNALANMFYLGNSTVQKINCVEMFKQCDYIDITPYIDRALEGEVTVIPTRKITFKTSSKWVSAKFYPVTDFNGIISSVMCLFEDVSEIKQMENNVLDMQKKMDEMNLMKSKFLSNLSHEIRTPMNGIIGFIELLAQEQHSSIQQNYIDLIKQSSEQMMALLNSLIDISRLESGQEFVSNKWFSPESIIMQINEYIQLKLIESGKENIQIKLITDDLPNEIQILSDPEKLTKALVHIADNAVKFTSRGTIKLGVRYVENKEIEFLISDTGMGIDEKNYKAIFLPFITFKDSNHSVYDGIGLGLTISKGLIDLLNGNIDIEPVFPHGSSFYITIPLNATDLTEHNTTLKLTNTLIRKMLVVQYGFESTHALRDILKPYNVNVIQAYDGIGAIEMYYENRDIDIVLCDIRLSDMTGEEVLKSILRINKSAKVIAQTAYFIADEKKKCIEAGFADYLVKPIDKAALLSVINLI
jgi:PAS domain S-box-containing protein